MNEYIPIEVISEGKQKVWYLDTSMLSLEDLTELRKKLNGDKTESVLAIDAIIHQRIGYDMNDLKSAKRELQKSKGLYKNSKAYVSKKRRGR